LAGRDVDEEEEEKEEGDEDDGRFFFLMREPPRMECRVMVLMGLSPVVCEFRK
jgi:hypothetical protein